MGKEAGGGPKRKKHHSGYYVSKGKVRTTHMWASHKRGTTHTHTNNTTQHNTNTAQDTPICCMEWRLMWVNGWIETRKERTGDVGTWDVWSADDL